jgi:RimJ/RimL family protein N-acetyltransferase
LALSRSFATLVDDGEFAAFDCCGDAPTPYTEEAENYVRVWALRQGKGTFVLAFRDEGGDLAGVAAFERDTVQIRGPDPSDHAAWRLQVVAVRSDLQNSGLSAEIFEGTFSAMKETDPYRDVVVAKAHRENRASRKACANVGLDTFDDADESYVVVLGRISEMEQQML